jgi:hypothetical protein
LFYLGRIGANAVVNPSGSSTGIALFRRSNVAGMPVGIELERLQQQPDIVEILHPAVGSAKQDHCLKFLHNHGLAGITGTCGRMTIASARGQVLRRSGPSAHGLPSGRARASIGP